MTRAEILKELYEIQEWLRKNDWKVNKFVLGEWQEEDPRWQDYLTEREEKRARQDILNYILKGGK